MYIYIFFVRNYPVLIAKVKQNMKVSVVIFEVLSVGEVGVDSALPCKSVSPTGYFRPNLPTVHLISKVFLLIYSASGFFPDSWPTLSVEMSVPLTFGYPPVPSPLPHAGG